MHITRKNKNFIITWWRSIDQVIVASIGGIIAFSAIMVAAASPSVADRIGVESLYFVRRQLVFLLCAIFIMTAGALLSPKVVRRFSIFGLIVSFVLLALVLKFGIEIKGSKRWFQLGSLSMQPSEFAKPFFAVVNGWILSKQYDKPGFPSFYIAFALYFVLVVLLILQPDFGMTVTVSLVWGGQMFLAGLSIIWVMAAIAIAIFGVFGAYILLPHVASRINGFIDPSSSENYQVKRSMEAFVSGGIYGRGPGEGVVKQVLPDSHTDFIFSVIGEELGMIACILVILMFGTIVVRGLIKMLNETDSYVMLASSGLLIQFGIQSFINMGVTLHLLPTKGMTLPFISYGGSSMFASSIAMGMILALTRKRYGNIKSSGARNWQGIRPVIK